MDPKDFKVFRNPNTDFTGGRQSAVSGILLTLYRAIHTEGLRWLLRRIALKLEGGELYSVTARKMFQLHGVDIGLYTYGPLKYHSKNLSPGTTIGRYSSVYPSVRRYNLNHTMNTKSTHPFFSDPSYGKVRTGFDLESEIVIGSDVWIGNNVTILNTVESIGDGAVVAAGAVLTNNVPPFAIVAGYPARVVKYRFSEETIQRLLQEKWWLKTIEELGPEIDGFRQPLEVDGPVR